MSPATRQTVIADEESAETILNVTTHPNARTISVELLVKVKKMNENFKNISYFDEEDEAANDIDGVETASLDAQVAQLTNSQTLTLWFTIAQDLDVREKTGSAISDGPAGILTSLLKDKLADEKIKSKIDKYPRPSNVDGLRTLRVNHLIWNHLPALVRTQDSKMQNLQNDLVASLVAMRRATELVLKESKDNKELVRCMTDTIALAIQDCHDMNITRRQAMKKELNKN